MSVKMLLECAEIAGIVVCLSVLSVMWRTKQISKFKALALYVLSLAVLESIQVPLLFFRAELGISKMLDYKILFYSSEVLSLVGVILVLAILYGVFHEAMRPLKGLQRMGTMVFKWVIAVSSILGLVIAFGPHILSSGSTADVALTTVIERAQEGVNVLMLCLLLFVCVAIKPLGMTYRSHVFGVALALGIISVTELVQSAWFYTGAAHSVYSPIYLFGTVGYLCALGTLGVWMAIPEPERKMILLPTTSPFFHWNRISEALGDSPGQVAIGFKPSMISPIEVKMMTAMSKAKRERESAAAAAEVHEQMESVAVS